MEVGDTVAVIGGGLTGCEIAYELELQGRKPVIIEMTDDLIRQKGVCLANSSYLREYFAWKKVPVYLNTRLTEVKDGAVVCADADGKEFEIPCDSVISRRMCRSSGTAARSATSAASSGALMKQQ